VFKSIRTNLGLVFGLLILIGAISTGTTLWVVRSQSADALVINLAGRERMLSQRVAKLTFLGTQRGQDPRYLAEMHLTAHEWEDVFLALRDGGNVVYEGRVVSLPPTMDPTIRAQLERVWSVWQPFHSAMHAVLENPPNSPAFTQGLADVESLSESILVEMDQAVQLYEAAAAARVARVEQMQVAFLLAGVAVIALGFGLISWQIIRPLDLLGVAIGRVTAGDLGSPVPTLVKNEIGALAATFDGMRRRLAQRNAEAQERLERITALHDIDVAITTTLNLKVTLGVLLEKVTERLSVDAAAVALIKPETRELIYAARRGLDGEFFMDGLLKVKEGIAGQVAYSGEPAAIVDVSAEPRFVRRPIAEKLGIVSYLVVPLRTRSGIIGVLELATRQRHTFPPEEVDFFTTLAGQAAVAIENAQLFAQAQERLAHLSALREAEQAITSTLNLPAQLTLLLEHTLVQMRADMGAVMLVDATTGELVEVAQQGERHPEFWRGFRLKIGEGAGGWIAEHGQPLAIPDVHQETRWAQANAADKEGIVSYLGAPLRVGGRVIGVLNVATRTPREFTAEEVGFFATLAGQAAVAIQNAQLYASLGEEKRRLELLYNLSQRLTESLNPYQVAATALDYICSALGAFRGTVFIAQPGTDRLRLLAASGMDRAEIGALHESVDLQLGRGLTGWTAVQRKTMIVSDVAQEEHWVTLPGLDEWVRSAISVPLLVGDQLVGVLNLLSDQRAAFREEHVAILQTATASVAVALENARLFEETRRRALEQSAVSEIARALNAALDVREAFPAVVQGLRALTDCDRVSIALLDETNTQFTLFLIDRPRSELAQGSRHPISATSAAADILAGRIHLTPDLSAELDYPAEQALYEAGHRSRVNLPLIMGERVIGALNIVSPQVGAFTPSQLMVLQQIAGAVAIALENTRLFEAEQTRRAELATLYDLSRALADTTDSDTILSLITRRAVETLQVTFARVALFDGENFFLRAACPARGLDRDLGVGRREHVAAHPYCQRVLEQNMPVVLRADDPELSKRERELLFLDLAQTLCLVPLRVGDTLTRGEAQGSGRAFGLLMLGEVRREEREPFTAEKIRLAHSISDQAASALHRAELFAELERSYLQTVLALANSVDAKDNYTADHALSLAQMALAVGRELGLTPRELEDLRYGAILHDIGKIGVPDTILQKPAKLDADEWTQMRRHPEIGSRILTPVPRLAGASQIVRHHHERFDGKGYPDGLAGESIPLGARILTVVDSYSAITDVRVYKKARSHEEAVAELKKHSGTQFDPRIVKVFLRVLKRGFDITGGGGSSEKRLDSQRFREHSAERQP
jgi:GAF domain-containing protein/HAMP domain-containing protein